jgi:hypothetical protein
LTQSSTQVAEKSNVDRSAGAADTASSGRGDVTEQFVISRIEAAQSALWRAELTRRVLTLVIAGMAALLAWFVLDQWIVPLGTLGRSLIVLFVLLAVAVYGYLRLWPVMSLQISEDYAARALERDHPELGHSLSSYVSLRRQREIYPGGQLTRGQLAQRVVQSIGTSVATKLKQVDAPPTEATGLMSWWAAVIAMLAALAIYSFVSPKNSFQSAARLLQPLSNLEAPRRIEISDVKPGDCETLAGRGLEVVATVHNLREDEPVYFQWETADRQASEKGSEESTPSSRQIRLLPIDDSLANRDRFAATIAISHHAHGTRKYRIVAGDATAGPFNVAIRDTPVVQIREIIYEPPAYTGEPIRTSRTGAIKGVDGTSVQMIASVNRPITRARIEFNPRQIGPNIQSTAGSSEMEISGDGLSATHSFKLRTRTGGAIALQDYRIVVWDDADQSNADPIVYPIEVIEDLPPEITIVVPQRSPKDVPINAQQMIEIHAADVDYGLAQIEIEVRRGIDLVTRATLFKDPLGKKGNQVVEYQFRPSRMVIATATGRRTSGLNVGDEVELVAIATDNRFDESDETIVPGVTKTPPVRLKITAADEQAGEGQQGEGQQGEGQQGEGQQGEGQQGKGQQGKGQQGEGQQGEGQQGKGQQGEGQQGEGQQGKGQQGKGQQGKGQQGEGQQGEGQEGDREQSQGGNGSSESEPTGDPSNGTSEGQPSENSANNERASDTPRADQDQTKPSTGDQSGKSAGTNSGQSNAPKSESPPQDDAEAFERIQDYLNKNQQEKQGNQNQQGTPSKQSQNQQSPQEKNSGDPGQEQPQDVPQDSQAKGEPGSDAAGNEGKDKGNGESNDLSSDSNDNKSNGDAPPQSGTDKGKKDAAQSRKDAAQSGKDAAQSGKDAAQSGKDAAQSRKDAADAESSDPANSDSDSAPDASAKPSPKSNPEAQSKAEGAEQQGQPESNDSKDSSDSNKSNKSDSAADSAAGAPSNKGEPGKSDSGQPNSGEQPGDPESGDRSEPTEAAGSPNSSGTPQNSGSPKNGENSESSQGGGAGQAGGGAGEDQAGDEKLPDPVDLQYTRRATDMVLDYLDETRTDPDPELLDRLKWSEQDLQRFRERWQNIKPIENASDTKAPDASEINEALRSLGMRPPVSAESSRRDNADDVRGLRDAGNRRAAPADIRDAYEAFRRGLSNPHDSSGS